MRGSSDDVERVARSELWAEGEGVQVAVGRGRGDMANWRVDGEMKGVNEVEGDGIVSVELKS